MPLVDVEEVKDWLNVKEHEQDDLLGNLETRVSRYMEGVTRRVLVEDTAVRQNIVSDGSRMLWLRSPIKPTTTPVVEERERIDGAFAVISSSIYEFEELEPDWIPIRRRIDRKDGQNWRVSLYEDWANYRVTWTAGYTELTVPEDLKQAALDILTASYRNRVTQFGVVPVTTEGHDAPITVPTTARQTLKLYTSPIVLENNLVELHTLVRA